MTIEFNFNNFIYDNSSFEIKVMSDENESYLGLETFLERGRNSSLQRTEEREHILLIFENIKSKVFYFSFK